jgi:hypothetical protein
VAHQPRRSEKILNFRMHRMHTAESLDESFALFRRLAVMDFQRGRQAGALTCPYLDCSGQSWRMVNPFSPALRG